MVGRRSLRRRPEEGQLHLVIDVLDAEPDRHADVQVLGGASHHVRYQPRPFLELDEGTDDGVLEAGELGVVHHGMAVHSSAT